MYNLRLYDFRIQFCWQEQPRGKREEKKMAQQNGTSPDAAAVGGEPAPTGDSS
jgi:hypothetical protein